jgi:hypothetical protein
MTLPHPKLTILTLTIIVTALAGSVAVKLNTTRKAHPTKQAAHTTTAPKASPEKLAADEAAYRASITHTAQLQQVYDDAKQAEQTALDKYGDTSPEYQAAQEITTSAKTAYAVQLQDQYSKGLQVQIDGGTTGD